MRVSASLLITSLVFAGAARGAVTWDPIPSEELAATASTVDPDASAEILLRDERIDSDPSTGVEVTNFFRIKVYTTKGVEELAKIDVMLATDETMRDLAGRMTKADGTVVELDPGSVFTRDAYRFGTLREVVKSGAIVEYR